MAIDHEKHKTGMISMANAGLNTDGSQIFITHSPQPHLNGKPAVCGRVVKGRDVVAAVRANDVMTKVTVEILADVEPAFLLRYRLAWALCCIMGHLPVDKGEKHDYSKT